MTADLDHVIELRRSGDLREARLAAGRLLASHPDNPGIMRELAIIATDEGNQKDAERLLLRISELKPGELEPITDLARFYAGRRDYIAAVKWYRRATEIASDDADAFLGLAQGLSVIGQTERADAAFRTCLQLDPANHVAMLGHGHTLRMLGQREAAVQLYRECLTNETTHDEACWSLASLRNFSFTDAELAQMQERASVEASPQLYFALARSMENRADFSAAWRFYEKGNAGQKSLSGYDHSLTKAMLEKVPQIYTEDVCTRVVSEEPVDVRPIFVVGMPRSGSTLVEQILASHPDVEPTAELPYLNDLSTGLLNAGISIGELSAGRLRQFRDQYLGATEIHRTQVKPCFIDKLPDNFIHIGFIHLVLPHAVVVDVRRDPMDTCIANYRQFYAAGKEFSYDLDDMAGMYQLYLQTMDHWHSVVPGRVLTVHYEDLVGDLEPEVRKLLHHCGLNWHDGCLDFHQTERSVVTASAEQVRQPIYSDAVGYWRRYESEVGVLLDAFNREI